MYRNLIFVISGILLVPFIYTTTSIPDVCAEIRDPKYDTGTCTGSKFSKSGQTCCWREQVPGQILGVTYCQTCKAECDSKGDCNEKCTEKTKQATKVPEGDQSGPLGQGGVLEQQPTINNSTLDKFKDRDLEQLQDLEQAEDKDGGNSTFRERDDISGSVINNTD